MAGCNSLADVWMEACASKAVSPACTAVGQTLKAREVGELLVRGLESN
jgi:hypothetical protein